MSEEEKNRIVSLQDVREKKLEEKKRKNERIFFTHLISVSCTDAMKQVMEVQVIDISLEGCAFQIPYHPRLHWPQAPEQPLTMRFYFTRDTYLEVSLQIQNRRDYIDAEQRSIRYGCSVDTELQSYEAYQAFVHFLKLYSLHAHKEVGRSSVFF